MSTTRFEESVISANVNTWHDTWSTDQRSADIGHDVTIKIRHDHNIELLRFSDELHRSVIYDHVVESDTRTLILLRYASASVEEQTVTQFHDVGFVHCCHSLSAVLDSKVKGKASDALCFGDSADLKRLYNAWVRLVLETGVLSLSILANDCEIDVSVTSRETWEGFAVNDGSVNVKGLAHSYVPAVVRVGLERSVENTFETDFVALDRFNGFEELWLTRVGLPANIVLRPLDGCVERLEDFLDRLG